METKVCGICKKEYPATTEFFPKEVRNRDGLHGTCKKCKHELSKKSLKKRVEKRKSVECELCKELFKPKSKNQRFCSLDCRIEWQRTDEEQIRLRKEIAKKQFEESFKEREQAFKERFEKEYKNFKYHSGYTNTNGFFNRECRTCGRIDSVGVRILWGKQGREKCEICEKIEIEERRKIKQEKLAKEREEKKKERLVLKQKRAYIKKETDILKRVHKNHKYYLTCEQCGREYFSTKNKLTCSVVCSKRRINKVKETKRRKQLFNNGKVDHSISVQRLMKRDNNICHLCGEVVDEFDCYTRANGAFIAGDRYPSVDHVIPVTKGGTHTWSNVKLAHRRCNTIKSDAISERYDNLNADIPVVRYQQIKMF